ncbi:MAG: diaminopimelate decarboxylase, partial [Planctomycetota bacterium]
MKGFAYEDDELHADGTKVSELASAAGTPLFVYSWAMVLDRLRELRRAFAELSPRIRYAIKANSNGALLRLLREAGAGFDVVSGGELQRVLQSGSPPGEIVFAGVGKQDWEIRLALRAGIGMINVESEGELARIRELARAHERSVDVALRLNPDVDADTHEYISTGRRQNKFGVDFSTADRLVGTIHDDPFLELRAYHVHLGSLLLDPGPYLEAAAAVMDFLDEDEGRMRGVRSYDMGGGFGVRGLCEEPLELGQLAEGMRELLIPRGLDLMLEPGRYLVGNAGLLLTRVLVQKPGSGKDFVVVDAAMNDLLRPALYGAEHEILPVRGGRPPASRPVDIVGPICETADFLGLSRALPELEAGELLAVCNAGAYGASMASNYNSRPLAAEVLTGEGAPRLIRRRQEHGALWQDEVEETLDPNRPAREPHFELGDSETGKDALG